MGNSRSAIDRNCSPVGFPLGSKLNDPSSSVGAFDRNEGAPVRVIEKVRRRGNTSYASEFIARYEEERPRERERVKNGETMSCRGI